MVVTFQGKASDVRQLRPWPHWLPISTAKMRVSIRESPHHGSFLVCSVHYRYGNASVERHRSYSQALAPDSIPVVGLFTVELAQPTPGHSRRYPLIDSIIRMWTSGQIERFSCEPDRNTIPHIAELYWTGQPASENDMNGGNGLETGASRDYDGCSGGSRDGRDHLRLAGQVVAARVSRRRQKWVRSRFN